MMLYDVAVGVPFAARQRLEARPVATHTQLFSAVPDAVRQKYSPALDAFLLGARFEAIQLNHQPCWHVSLPELAFCAATHNQASAPNPCSV
jgi:hypothetical protein